MHTVNIKDLARELNVAVSTVSRALRDSHDISQETKNRVLALARERNYQPHPYAGSLRRHTCQTIAVIVPELASNFFSQVLNGVQAVAQNKGYHVLIYQTYEDASREAEIVQHLRCGRADGFLISLSNKTTDLSALEAVHQQGLPLVFFDRVSAAIAAPKVITNDYESAFAATEHLLEQGCSRIAYLMLSRHLSIGARRYQGYEAALAKHGIPATKELVLEGCLDKNEYYHRIRNLLLQPNRPDAVFASIEALVLACYQVCQDIGLRIPEDVKVVGFSNMEAASLLQPALTTIVQPAYEMGETAATLLFRALRNKRPDTKPAQVVLQSKLVVRASSMAAALV